MKHLKNTQTTLVMCNNSELKPLGTVELQTRNPKNGECYLIEYTVVLNKATRQTLGTERCLICHTHVGTIVEVEVEVGTAENYKMQSLRLEPKETELQRKTIQMSLQTKTYIFFGHLPASYPISMANRLK